MNFDMNYRPNSYFWPQSLETFLMSSVKGTKRQNHIRTLIAQGRVDEVPDWMAHESLSDEERTALGRMHPRFMGGEYLPDLMRNEVEIARISLESVTGDVISVRARRGKHRIYYRIVDEYGDEGENEDAPRPTRLSSIRPLTLAQLEQMIEETEFGLKIIQRNWEYGADPESLHFFLSASSPFYPELEALYQFRIDVWLASKAPEDEDHER